MPLSPEIQVLGANSVVSQSTVRSQPMSLYSRAAPPLREVARAPVPRQRAPVQSTHPREVVRNRVTHVAVNQLPPSQIPTRLSVQSWVDGQPSEFSVGTTRHRRSRPAPSRRRREPSTHARRGTRRSSTHRRRSQGRDARPSQTATTLDDIVREIRRGNDRQIAPVVNVSERMSTAALEVVKSCRPTEKFEDEDGKVDLRSHLTHFSDERT